MLQQTSPEAFRAFVPKLLPPEPPISFDANLVSKVAAASLSLGRLDGVSRLLPDVSLLLYFYIRNEAVLSSQIEGTQSSLSDLLLFVIVETPGVPLDDVQEVSNHVAAMEHGLGRIRGGFPLSTRLLREIHAVLLSRGRGSDKDPGEFRRSQNWINGTRPGTALFVPPPFDRVPDLMGNLEKFLHEYRDLPPLIKAAIAHVQFESIHPFLDGNGRLGRLIVTLLLCWEGVLKEPLLYLSLFLKSSRTKYFELLQAVRLIGDWESWISFFLEGVRNTADQAVDTAQGVIQLFEKNRKRIEEQRAPASVLRLHDFSQRRPLFTVAVAARNLKLTPASIGNAVQALEELGIVRQLPGRRRNRLFAYDEYLRLLSTGTGPTTAQTGQINNSRGADHDAGSGPREQ